MGTSVIALCPRCRRELLPALKGPSWHRDVHRAPAKNMTQSADPEAARIKARKARKQPSLRAVTREIGFLGLVRKFVDARTAERAAPLSDECADCQKRQGSRTPASSPVLRSA